MDHSNLLERNVPLENTAHEQIIQDRWSHVQKTHAKRLRNIVIEKALIRQDVWDPKKPQKEGERRISSSAPHQIIKMASSLMLPRPPTIRVMPDVHNGFEEQAADMMTKWMYAACHNLKMFSRVYPQWAKEYMFGVAGMMALPDTYALPYEEVPMIKRALESSSCLYHIGPRHHPDYVFVTMEMTVGDCIRDFDHKPKGYNRDTDRIEVQLYFAEERWRDASGEVNKMILYGVLDRGKLMKPLADATMIWPRIPVFLAFNTDGYNWSGSEDMNAYGILTSEHSTLLYATDLATQMSAGVIRHVDPPYALEQEDSDHLVTVNTNPGGVTRLRRGDKITPMLATMPPEQLFRYEEQLGRTIANNTIRSLRMDIGDLQNVTGSTLADQLNPDLVHMRSRQFELAVQMREELHFMTKYLSSTMHPDKPLTIEGVNPHTRENILATANPAMLAHAKNIHVKLAAQTPSNVVKYVTLLMQLVDKNLVPHQMAVEHIHEWMEFDDANMTDVMKMIGSDRMYAMQAQLLQQQAAELVPALRQQMNQEGLSPQLINGEKPYALSSQFQDPHQNDGLRQQGPMQQQAANRRLLTQG